MMKKRAILMCAGEYEPVEILPGPEDLVVAVDGGLERLLSQRIEPDLVLGDFDSLPESCRPYLTALEEKDPERLLRLPCEKDDTDTIYAAPAWGTPSCNIGSVFTARLPSADRPR